MPQVQLHTGPARSERAARLNASFQENWSRALMLVPTPAVAMRRREALARGGGHAGLWGRRVYEFTEFAIALLEMEGMRVHRIGDFERKLLLEACLESIGGLSAFPSHTPEEPHAQGTLRHLLRVITQIKQAALEPADFRKRTAKHGAPVDTLVADAYAAYQDALKAADAYDVPGVYWAAEACCREGRPKMLDGIDTVLLDGFDDFTPSQFRFVSALAPHVALLTFGMTHDDTPSRRDLYSISAEAVARIQRDYEVSPVSHAAPEARAAHQYAANAFLSRDRGATPQDLTATLRFSTYLDATHEFEAIGRRVKQLILKEHVHPADIAIVFRNLADAAPQLRSVFRGYGIPACIRHPLPLSQSTLGAFLPRLTRALTTWEREEILDVLGGEWLGCAAHAEAFPLLARSAGIVEGEAAWRTRLERLEQRLEKNTGRDMQRLRERLPNAAEALAALREAIERLTKLKELLPDSAAASTFTAGIEKLLAILNLEELDDAGRAALAALRELLTVLCRTAADGAVLTKVAWLRRFEQGLAETACAVPAPRHGVAVLDAPAIRNLRFKHVFFGGLNEGSIPAPPPGNVFYADRDIERMRGEGIALEGRRHHGGRERLLFHHVLEAAEEQLHLSWRLANDNGQEASRSPFLAEVLDHFPDAAIETPAEDSFLPPPEEAASLRELRNAAYHGSPKLRAEGEATGRFAATAHGAAIERVRRDTSPFGIYDGRLSGGAITEELSAHFGPDHVYSVNQLECFAECPFRFFAQRVLNTEETAPPAAEIDPRLRGVLLHGVLGRFHAAHRGKHLSEIPEDALRDSLAAALDAAFDYAGAQLFLLPKGVVRAERARLDAVLNRYIRQCREEEDNTWKPSHFEAAFGSAGNSEDTDPASVEKPYTLDTKVGPILLAGRIDRIDRAGEQVRLVDYKSGATPSAGHITSGRAIQLSLYARAVTEHMLPDSSCTEAIYLSVGKTKTQTSLTGTRKPWSQREDNVLNTVSRAVRAARNGNFPPTPADKACTYCAYRDVCRYEAARVEAKSGKSAPI